VKPCREETQWKEVFRICQSPAMESRPVKVIDLHRSLSSSTQQLNLIPQFRSRDGRSTAILAVRWSFYICQPHTL
jgi:hypothetical protein